MRAQRPDPNNYSIRGWPHNGEHHGAPVLAASHPAWLAPLVVKSLLARSAVNAAVLVVGDVTDTTNFTAILLAKLGAAAAVAAVTAKVLRLRAKLENVLCVDRH